MSHPPQQPGQSGWGPPQQPGFGQQPGYGQPGHGQQPGGQYPQSGPQQVAWGAQPGHGQPGRAWGQQPGFEQPPKKNRTGLVVGIAVAAAVLLIGGGIGIFMAVSGGPSAKEFAQKYTDLLENRFHNPTSPRSLQKLKAATCSRFHDELEGSMIATDTLSPDELRNLRQISASMTDLQVHGDTAGFTAELRHPDEEEPLTLEVDLIKEDGMWKGCPSSE